MRCVWAIACAFTLLGCEATIGGPRGLSDDDQADASSRPADAGPGATPADATPPPIDPPDAAGQDASIQARCENRYGGVPGFEFCQAEADTCTFIATNGDVSCGAHCAGAGGLCLGAQDNDVGECFDLEGDPTADCETTGKIDLLCTCTLPAGP